MPKIRNIIIFICIAAAVFLGYFYFTKTRPPEEAALVSLPVTQDSPTSNDVPNSDVDSGTPVLAGEFLSLLLSVENIKLEDAIFSNPAFKNLKDSSIVITGDGTEGRPNPFARIGSDAPVAPITPPATETPPAFPLPPTEPATE
ncbi:MAG: hypothetical protein WCT29_02050 [Candidatus Paceibacterota bacterium]|jgi:hypothetical protein